jgi:hypothetical protein
VGIVMGEDTLMGVGCAATMVGVTCRDTWDQCHD